MQSAARSYDGWDSQAAIDRGHLLQFAAAGQPPAAAEAKGGKRSRQTYSKYQTAVLETVFQTSKYIVRNKRQQMSAELELTERQIKIWFQNRRMKEKKCHKDVPRIDVHGATTLRRPTTIATVAAGYADDYAAAGTTANNNNNNNPQRPDERGAFVGDNYLQDPASKSHRDVCDFGVYDGGYDVQSTAELDPYAVVKQQQQQQQQQWPHSGTVDFHHSFYDNVADYYPPQLQATHGY